MVLSNFEKERRLIRGMALNKLAGRESSLRSFVFLVINKIRVINKEKKKQKKKFHHHHHYF